LPKAFKSWSLLSDFSSSSSMLTILGKHLAKQAWLYNKIHQTSILMQNIP
jgi:hypothetical protein